MHEGRFNHEKSNIFKQFARVGGSVPSFTWTQTCRFKVYEFWPNFTFLLDQQIKFPEGVDLAYLQTRIRTVF